MQRAQTGAVGLDAERTREDSFEGFDSINNIENRELTGVTGEQETAVQSTLGSNQAASDQALHPRRIGFVRSCHHCVSQNDFLSRFRFLRCR